MNSSRATINISSKNHFWNNSLILELERLSSYNIEYIVGSFTFDLHWKEVSRKKFQKVKESDGTLREIKEYEVLF